MKLFELFDKFQSYIIRKPVIEQLASVVHAFHCRIRLVQVECFR